VGTILQVVIGVDDEDRVLDVVRVL